MATFPIEELVPLVAPPVGEALVALAVAASGSGTGKSFKSAEIIKLMDDCKNQFCYAEVYFLQINFSALAIVILRKCHYVKRI